MSKRDAFIIHVLILKYPIDPNAQSTIVHTIHFRTFGGLHNG